MLFIGGTELWVLLLVDYFDLLKADMGFLIKKPLLNCSDTVERLRTDYCSVLTIVAGSDNQTAGNQQR